MTDRIFVRWRVALVALFLLAEGLWVTQGAMEPLPVVLTIALTPAVWKQGGRKRWFVTFLPAFWLLVLCVLRLSGQFAGRALTALSPALCGLVFVLAAVQLARHGRAALCQWAHPMAWALGLGCVLAVLLGWPAPDDLAFLLLVLLTELARCAALVELLQ